MDRSYFVKQNKYSTKFSITETKYNTSQEETATSAMEFCIGVPVSSSRLRQLKLSSIFQRALHRNKLIQYQQTNRWPNKADADMMKQNRQ